jgi:hypothetical protein
MKIFLKSFFTIFLLYQLSVNAQDSQSRLSFSVSTGYGSFNMHHLKELNDEIESQLPFDVKSVDNFDPGFYFGASLQTIFCSRLLAGIIYQYYTTGSRIGQKDYSGYYTFDQIANGHFVGLEPGMILLNKKVITIAASVQGGALFSGIKMNEQLVVGEVENTDSQNLRAFSIAITPAVKASFPIIPPLRCSLSVGRMFDTGGEVHLPENRDAVLIINNSTVKTGWSGWRVAIELNINFINH